MPLVIPLPVIMSGELASRLPKRPFPEEDHAVQALILDRPDEPLRVGVEGTPLGEPGVAMAQDDPRDFGTSYPY